MSDRPSHKVACPRTSFSLFFSVMSGFISAMIHFCNSWNALRAKQQVKKRSEHRWRTRRRGPPPQPLAVRVGVLLPTEARVQLRNHGLQRRPRVLGILLRQCERKSLGVRVHAYVRVACTSLMRFSSPASCAFTAILTMSSCVAEAATAAAAS